MPFSCFGTTWHKMDDSLGIYVKEYRSRSVAVLTPSYGLAQSVLGIRPTYKMRNISELSQWIYSKLSGFLAIAICGSCAKNYRNRGCQF